MPHAAHGIQKEGNHLHPEPHPDHDYLLHGQLHKSQVHIASLCSWACHCILHSDMTCKGKLRECQHGHETVGLNFLVLTFSLGKQAIGSAAAGAGGKSFVCSQLPKRASYLHMRIQLPLMQP